jgi:hypothetical protein
MLIEDPVIRDYVAAGARDFAERNFDRNLQWLVNPEGMDYIPGWYNMPALYLLQHACRVMGRTKMINSFFYESSSSKDMELGRD